MVFTRKKSRADANPESSPITQHKINIREVQTTSQTVFTQEQNESFLQQVVQETQGLEGEVFHYHVIGLNQSSTEDDLKNPIVKWLLDTPSPKKPSTGFYCFLHDKRG